MDFLRDHRTERILDYALPWEGGGGQLSQLYSKDSFEFAGTADKFIFLDDAFD